MKIGYGNCFQVAGEAFLCRCMTDEPQDLVIVHGRPRLTVEPYIRYGHAWTEEDGELVYDPNGKVLPKDLYYAVGQIDPNECARYTYKQYVKKLVQEGHWGSWDIPEDPEEKKLRKKLERRKKK